MRAAMLHGFAAAALLLPACQPDSAPRTIPYDRTTTAFVNVNVVTMRSPEVLPNRTVIVRDGRIARIGPARTTPVPEGARVISGSGRWLMPGLADMHVHLSGDWQLPRYVADGVTTVRNMAGRPWHVEMREEVALGERFGPMIVSAGPLLDGDPPVWPGSVIVTGPGEARRAVQGVKRSGYDYVKMYSLLNRTAFDGIVGAARAEALPVVGHAPYAVSFDDVLAAAPASLEHNFGFLEAAEAEDSPIRGVWNPRRIFHAVHADSVKLKRVAERAAESGVYFCPTAVLFRYWAPPMAQAEWQVDSLRSLGEANRVAIIRALHQAGARIMAGTDTGGGGFTLIPGAHLFEELGIYVAAGMTPYEALATATRTAAEFLGGADEWGTVAEGLRADLVLVEANPLESIENARARAGVMVRGRWIEAAAQE